MDRDSRWERVQRAYDLLVHGIADHHASTAAAAAAAAYARGETDEFITPTRVGRRTTSASTTLVIAFNFRSDRMREITRAWLIRRSPRSTPRARAARGDMTLNGSNDVAIDTAAFAPARPAVTLPHVVAEAAGGSQLHAAGDKLPHAPTFFAAASRSRIGVERRQPVRRARSRRWPATRRARPRRRRCSR